MAVTNVDWRNDPITRKQISALRSVDEWFTFNRLNNMTKGEASDYIDEYYKDKKVIEENINMRYNKEGNDLMNGKDNVRGIVNNIVKEVVEEATKTVLKKYGLM